MATTSTSNVQITTCDWSITGLSLYWNSSNYISAGVATSPASGTIAAPLGIKSTITPPASGSGTSMSGSASGFSAGSSYSVYGWARTKDGKYWPCGVSYISTMPNAPTGISTSVNGLNVTINFTKGSGAYATNINKGWGGTSSTTGTSFSFTMSSYSTQYSFTLQSSSGDAVYGYYTSMYYFTTGTAPPQPLSAPSISNVTSTNNSISYTCAYVPNATSYYVELRIGSTFITNASYSGAHNHTFYNLSPSTTYTITITVSAPGYTSASASTSRATLAPPALAQPTLSSSSVTSKSVTFAMNAVSNATWYDCSLYKNGVFQSNYAGSSARSGTFDNLVHGSTYVLHLTVSASGYTDNTNDISKVTTTISTPGAPTNVSFAQHAAGSQYVDANFTYGANTNRMDIDMDISPYNGTSWGSIDWPNQQNTSYSLDTGSAQTRYFRLRPSYYDGYNRVYGSWTSGIQAIFANRPTNFAWSFTIVSGGDIYSQSGKDLFLMPHSDWNAFTTRINAFRVYCGLGAISFTTVNPNQAVTKDIFNEARNALYDIRGYFTGGNTIPNARITGDNILVASYYANMRDAMNSIV